MINLTRVSPPTLCKLPATRIISLYRYLKDVTSITENKPKPCDDANPCDAGDVCVDTNCYMGCDSDRDCQGRSTCETDGNGNNICVRTCSADGDDECYRDDVCDVANGICLREREEKVKQGSHMGSILIFF